MYLFVPLSGVVTFHLRKRGGAEKHYGVWQQSYNYLNLLLPLNSEYLTALSLIIEGFIFLFLNK